MAKNGFEYEKIVLESIRKAGLGGLLTTTAGANANAPDADFRIKDKIYNLEIKLDSHAQMGGSSISYNRANRQFDFVGSVPDDIKEILLFAISTKEIELNNLLEYVTQNENNIPEVQQKFPFTCSKETWENAQKNKLLVNVAIPSTIDFLRYHLSKKNIHYIQIGGKGLYYTESNPAQLPIEQLKGNFTVEIRTGRSGSKPHPKGFRTVTGAIRIQGRLEILNDASKYTMDDENSILRLSEEIKNIP